MRLIDADALIETIRNFVDTMSVCTSTDYCNGLRFMKKQAIEAVENAPTIEPASPWHRVEEELPDLLQFVVVCNDEGKCVVAQYVGYQTDSLTPWRIAYTMYDTDICDEKECGPVRYWIPIEPPKEEMK